MGRHRQNEDGVSRSEPTQILPLVKPRRLHASPLLVGAGAVALTLVIGVGGWALLGNRSDGDPLVFPWSGEKPSDIDVSVSMVPTDEPVPSPVDSPSVSPSPSRPKVPKEPSPRASAIVSVSAVPSRSIESLAGTITAKVVSYGTWQGNVMINVDIRNPSGKPVTAWTLELWMDKDVNVYQEWNGRDQQVDARHLKFVQDRTLNAGETVRLGFIARFDGSRKPQLTQCRIDGVTFPCSVG